MFLVFCFMMKRMIKLPTNRNYCFPGGVGDPSAVASGDHLYVFFGEYAYPTAWDPETWDRDVEHAAQCISVARVPLASLDAPHAAPPAGLEAAPTRVGNPSLR